MRLGHVLAVAAALLVICAPLLEAGAAQVRQADHEGAGPGYIEAETISVADGADPEPDDSADVTPGEDSAASGHRSRASRAQNALKRRVALMSSENRRLGELLAAAQSELESMQPTAMEAKRLVVAKAEAEVALQRARADEARARQLQAEADAEAARAAALAAQEQAKLEQQREAAAVAAAANATAQRELAEQRATTMREAAAANKAQADAAEAARSLELARLAHAEEVRASALANATVARDRAKADAEAAKRADAETRLAASRAEAARAEAARLESKRAVADAEARAAEAKALSASAESAAETRRADLLRSIVQEAASGAAGDMASNSSFVEALAGRLETISASLPDGSDPAAAARARKAASDAFQAEAVKLAAEHHVGTAEELAGGAEASLALNRTLEEALPRLGAAVADRVVAGLLAGGETSPLLSALNRAPASVDASGAASLLGAAAAAEARRLASVVASLVAASGRAAAGAREDARMATEAAQARAREAEASAAQAATELEAARTRAAEAASRAEAAAATARSTEHARAEAEAKAAAAAAEASAADAQARIALALDAQHTARMDATLLAVQNATAATARARAEAERGLAEAEASRGAALRAEAEERRLLAAAAAAQAAADLAKQEEQSAAARQRAAAAASQASAASTRAAEAQRDAAQADAQRAAAEASAVESSVKLAQLAAFNATEGVRLAEANRATAEAQLEAAQAAAEAAAARADLTALLAKVEEAKERTALAEASAAEARGEQDRQTERLRAELNRNTSLEAAREADRLARARDEERLRLEVAAAQAKEEARLAAELKIAEAAAGGEAAAAKARAEVEAAARIQQERDNEDVHERRRLKDAAAERERWLAVASASFDAIGDAGRAMVGPYLPQTVLAVLCVALAVYGSREALTLAGKAAALSLGKPRLVRETSLGSQPALDALDAVADAVTLGLTAWLAPEGVTAGLRASGPANPAAAFEGVVLGEELRESVIGLARSTRNAKSNHAPLRHALFYGPPGTGKTMAAQRLARSVGLDYAVMAGGDVAPLAAEAVTEIHRLFEWAKRSRRGLLLFIDEAEAFLGARDRAGGVSEHLRNVLSALLYQTGEQSSHYMMVLCTNRPEDLDAAVTDRVDQSLRFPLPEQQQRRAMVWQYFRSHVLARTAAEDAKRLADEAASVSAAGRQANGHSRPAGAANGKRGVAAGAVAPAPAPAPASAAADAPATPSRGCCAGRQPPQIRLHSDISASVIESLKVATAGFSGRQIGKLMLNVQGAVYAAEDVTLRRAMLDAVLSLEQRKHANKSRAEEAARAEAEATGRHTAFLGSWD
ncbi:hypothetical protein FNF27_00772 [Cafeteria roenbergensis]|uniref:AAA+ ATPase domain-containing protein n=2 Tax=Cafeteria roenbergensis TaxID=33653 RepID=A0A5A8EJB2_CAFRO|nr:hypothetical protein FNF27_00772 [Cafeteria roenbergensis]